MTNNFDNFCESMIKEYTTAKSKRRESRYFNSRAYSDGKIRRMRSLNSRMSDSQKTKVLNQQQYVGDFWEPGGIRSRNSSGKDHTSAGIAKGLDGIIKTNKKPGSVINSKQGEMEVKHGIGNGMSKVGRKILSNYPNMKKVFGKDL